MTQASDRRRLRTGNLANDSMKHFGISSLGTESAQSVYLVCYLQCFAIYLNTSFSATEVLEISQSTYQLGHSPPKW